MQWFLPDAVAIGKLLLVLLPLLPGLSCARHSDSQELETGGPPVSGLSGQALAQKHCSGCHSFVSPDQLPKSIWQQYVLPAMGYRLGITEDYGPADSLFGLPVNDPVLEAAGISLSPVMARTDWMKIVEYYTINAPDTVLTALRQSNITTGLKHFKYHRTVHSISPPNSAMVKILPDKQGVIFSDWKRNVNRLVFLNTDLKKNYELTFNHIPVHFHEKSGITYLATLGESIYPDDSPHGTLYKLMTKGSGNQYDSLSTVIGDLQRPVDFAYGDLNNDGLEDIVVCEFGNLTGNLSWFENKENGNYFKRVLRSQPGAIKVIIRDLNQDGRPDILALMAQGDEGIFLYLNQGNSVFKERRILSFSPLYGSQYFDLADFNNDGRDDILYVSGDNADKSPILKQYHGLYIYLNQGEFNFTASNFHHLNGAYKAIPRDFDLDGDLDIASISFYPDYLNYPEESFVYLENNGNLEFKEYTFAESTNGRWMVMDAQDMDSDGDIDLALGSNIYFLPKNGPVGLAEKWSEIGPSVIVLENTIR